MSAPPVVPELLPTVSHAFDRPDAPAPPCEACGAKYHGGSSELPCLRRHLRAARARIAQLEREAAQREREHAKRLEAAQDDPSWIVRPLQP